MCGKSAVSTRQLAVWVPLSFQLLFVILDISLQTAYCFPSTVNSSLCGFNRRHM